MYELPCYVDDKTTATRCRCVRLMVALAVVHVLGWRSRRVMRLATNHRILLRNNYRCHKEIVQFAAEFYPYNIIPNWYAPPSPPLPLFPSCVGAFV